LIQPKLAAAGESDCRDRPETLVADGPGDVDSLGSQFGNGAVNVVAHEVELVLAALFGRMGRQFRGR
jgi:hypothetical protein